MDIFNDMKKDFENFNNKYEKVLSNIIYDGLKSGNIIDNRYLILSKRVYDDKMKYIIVYDLYEEEEKIISLQGLRDYIKPTSKIKNAKDIIYIEYV